LLHHTDAATGQRIETLDNFRTRNNRLKEMLEYNLKTRFLESRMISGSSVLETHQLPGKTPREKFQSALSKHFKGIFKFLHLADNYSRTASDLRKKASDTAWQTTINGSLTEAEGMVNEHITNKGNEMTVYDLLYNFGKAPFGWKDVALLDILVELNRKKFRTFEYKHEPRYPVKDFIEKALNASERISCVVKSGDTPSTDEVEKALKNFREIFNVDLKEKSDSDKAFDEILKKIAEWRDSYKQLMNDYFGQYPFGVHFRQFHEQLDQLSQIRDIRRLFKNLDEEKESLKTISDKAKSLTVFIQERLKKYDEIKDFIDKHSENLNALPPESDENINILQKYFLNDDPEPDLKLAVKVYKELRASVFDLLNDLKRQCKTKCNEVFETLRRDYKDRAAEINLEEILESEDILQSIIKSSSISFVRLMLSQSDDFQAEKSTLIVKAINQIDKSKGIKVKEPVTFYIKRQRKTQLKSAEEVEEYIVQLKDDMLSLIKQGKTIIIK